MKYLSYHLPQNALWMILYKDKDIKKEILSLPEHCPPPTTLPSNLKQSRRGKTKTQSIIQVSTWVLRLSRGDSTMSRIGAGMVGAGIAARRLNIARDTLQRYRTTGGQRYIKLVFFFFLFIARISVPQPGIKPVPPAVEAQIPNCWTTREFPSYFSFNNIILFRTSPLPFI